jgi:hypothetical protein
MLILERAYLLADFQVLRQAAYLSCFGTSSQSHHFVLSGRHLRRPILDDPNERPLTQWETRTNT